MTEPNEYTAFIDLLGFSNYVDKNINTAEESKIIFDYFNSIEERFIQYYKNDISLMDSAKYKANFTMLSDAVVITLKPQILPLTNPNYEGQSAGGLYLLTQLIFDIAEYSIIQFGLPIRGGISIKKTFWDNKILVGKGLIEAYKLESKSAIYPRILISEELASQTKVIDIVNNIPNLAKQKNILNIVKKDNNDEKYYINIYAKIANTTFTVINDFEKAKNYKIELGEAFNNVIANIRKKDSSISKLYSDDDLVSIGIQSLSDKLDMFLKSYKKIIENNLNNSILEEKYKWLKNNHNNILENINTNSNFDMNFYKIT
ncbi:hypothetical protein N5T79_07550 [Aliarcobacter cryaerophilus]|uniref:hypothetical protein n=1 Tax=Aliarcobacter cryaerophilus TaxID=28198 RepID=UPI0021B5FFDA|nr:hypothetical protein [Aliarcobacter cryaerophilus]MCT7528997.1 hypothetical protein [Aliarcobacter cryaerophilus]